MRRKIYNGLTICFLVLTFFSAFHGEVNAQKPRGSQNKKPSEQAKKAGGAGRFALPAERLPLGSR
jgi:hypothetical protein